MRRNILFLIYLLTNKHCEAMRTLPPTIMAEEKPKRLPEELEPPTVQNKIWIQPLNAVSRQKEHNPHYYKHYVVDGKIFSAHNEDEAEEHMNEGFYNNYIYNSLLRATRDYDQIDNDMNTRSSIYRPINLNKYTPDIEVDRTGNINDNTKTVDDNNPIYVKFKNSDSNIKINNVNYINNDNDNNAQYNNEQNISGNMYRQVPTYDNKSYIESSTVIIIKMQQVLTTTQKPKDFKQQQQKQQQNNKQPNKTFRKIKARILPNIRNNVKRKNELFFIKKMLKDIKQKVDNIEGKVDLTIGQKRLRESPTYKMPPVRSFQQTSTQKLVEHQPLPLHMYQRARGGDPSPKKPHPIKRSGRGKYILKEMLAILSNKTSSSRNMDGPPVLREGGEEGADGEDQEVIGVDLNYELDESDLKYKFKRYEPKS